MIVKMSQQVFQDSNCALETTYGSNSISIDYIREVSSAKGEKVILELNGKLKNLSLKERLKYNLMFEDLGKYTKLNIFKDIENIFGD